MLGVREPETYGYDTLADVELRCSARAAALDLTIDFRQTNHEGQLVKINHHRVQIRFLGLVRKHAEFDPVPHNVISTEKKFASPVLDTDQTFSHTFDAPGTYKYYCSIHPRMTGQVEVA